MLFSPRKARVHGHGGTSRSHPLGALVILPVPRVPRIVHFIPTSLALFASRRIIRSGHAPHPEFLRLNRIARARKSTLEECMATEDEETVLRALATNAALRFLRFRSRCTAR
jgi:hypothetical protein